MLPGREKVVPVLHNSFETAGEDLYSVKIFFAAEKL